MRLVARQPEPTKSRGAALRDQGVFGSVLPRLKAKTSILMILLGVSSEDQLVLRSYTEVCIPC